MSGPVEKFLLALLSLAGLGLVFGAANRHGLFGEETAAWVQGVGTVAAVVGAAWIAGRQIRESAAKEARDRAAEEKLTEEAATANREVAAALLAHALFCMQSLAGLCSATDAQRINKYTARGLQAACDGLVAFPAHTLRPTTAITYFSTAVSVVLAGLQLTERLQAHLEEVDAKEERAEAINGLGEKLQQAASILQAGIDRIRDVKSAK